MASAAVIDVWLFRLISQRAALTLLLNVRLAEAVHLHFAGQRSDV